MLSWLTIVPVLLSPEKLLNLKRGVEEKAHEENKYKYQVVIGMENMEENRYFKDPRKKKKYLKNTV